MALIIADRVVETSTTTGTGNFALGGAYTGYRAFDDVMANADTCYYCIEAVDANGNPSGAWETGLGTFNDTDTLVRTSVHASTNSNNAVDFAAGTKRVSLNVTAAAIYQKGGADVALADGGTGASLVDPNADRILFWDDSAGATDWLSLSSHFAISGTTLSRAPRGALVKKSTDELTANYSTNRTMVWDGEEYDTDSIAPASATVTITIASPGVVTWTGHNFVANSPIVFTTTGALPTGLTAGTTYFVINPAANTFQVSATIGGGAINTSGTQSGTHTATNYSRLTVPAGATYARIYATVSISLATAADWISLRLIKNAAAAVGLPFLIHEGGSVNTGMLITTPVLAVAAGDYFEVQLNVETDASISVNSNRSCFAMEVVG